ncbi:MAG: type IV pilin protein [Gemmatimonadales bacterium]
MNRKGFTLIELLIVVVIIGILAAIAIPKFANTKEKAYLASMKSDLRNLVTAEESYFSDYQVYTAGSGSNIGGVGASTPANFFVPSAGVTVNFTAGTPAGAGWNASATHTGLTAGRTCAIFVGSSPGLLAPATTEGEPKCN